MQAILRVMGPFNEADVLQKFLEERVSVFVPLTCPHTHTHARMHVHVVSNIVGGGGNKAMTL